MWRDVVAHLARQYRVIAHDLRGHGHAAAAPLASDLGTYADDLVRLVEGLNLPKIHLVGLSLGGSIAQQVALSHPDRLESLTIIASTAWRNEAFSARAEAAERDGLAAQVAPTLTRWFTPQALAENGWAVRYARDRSDGLRLQLGGGMAGSRRHRYRLASLGDRYPDPSHRGRMRRLDAAGTHAWLRADPRRDLRDYRRRSAHAEP